MKPQSMVHKILASKCKQDYVIPGENIVANIDMCFAHDPVATVLSREFYNSFGSNAKVWDNHRFALFQDHMVPARNLEARNLVLALDRFAKEQSIKYYFPYGKDYGVCHIVMMEQGLALPGELVVGADSHTVTYGSLNCLSTGVGVFDIANLLATGELWFTVPEVIKIEINGVLPKDVQAKDIILTLLRDIKMDGAANKAIEWCGSTIENMSIDERSTLCNMVAELGAAHGIMALNKPSRTFVSSVAKRSFREIESDPGCEYTSVMQYRAENIQPMVACPHRPDNVHSVNDISLKKIKIDQVYVGGCTGGKIDDIIAFTEALDLQMVHPETQVIVVPASMRIYNQMATSGLISRLIQSGAVIESPGCKACYGLHGGVTGDGENCLATINRNFIGRMGNPKSNIYLSSPITAAKSAIAGYITK